MMERHPCLRCLHHWPTRFLCIAVFILQTVSINWYLMFELTYTWAAIYSADAVVLMLFITAIVCATKNMRKEKRLVQPAFKDIRHMPLSFVSWFVYALFLNIKVVVIFTTVSTKLDEVYFFGPNTLNTTLALSAILFISFLATQHDIRHGDRKDLLVAITGTVVFDILDGVDILEDLYEKDVRDEFPIGLDDAIIAVFCLNIMLPTVPLYTLAKTKFGRRKLRKRLEQLHKISIAYLINLPSLIIRMISWHGLGQGISIFILKNILALGVATFELLEHRYAQDSGSKVVINRGVADSRGQSMVDNQNRHSVSIVNDMPV